MFPDFFAGLHTPSEVKSLYRKLALEHHPDRGGDTATMQAINAQYEAKLKSLDGSKERGSNGEEHVYYYNEQHEKSIMEKLAELLRLDLPNCEILLIGKWLWVQGDTYPVRSLLGFNGAGMKWHSKRKAWYFKPYEWASQFNPGVSLDDLALTYGCRVFTTTGVAEDALAVA
jgi:hypothetical protein